MELSALMCRAMEIRKQYALLEQAQHGRSWSEEEIALGFIGDVGDLMKLVMGKNGVRSVLDLDAKLSHELADCLWSVLVLANSYGVDLEQAFLQTMDALELQIRVEYQRLSALG
jgi:NTP pyrophosphatase (non-canonical NTP hydrolase)